jgi:phosphatidylserine/phosphatidylglycerophosphate/cardiolipin synthase-like enzyme
LKLAKKEVFIQSPVFNASPIVQAVLDACKRGVTVTLYVGLGFNDFAEGIVPFQGGTNDDVRKRMQEELVKAGKQQYLRWHWYVAKDQNAPLRFEKQSRNCHVKFLQVDGQVAIMGTRLSPLVPFADVI